MHYFASPIPMTRYLGLLLGFLYLSFLAFSPPAEAASYDRNDDRSARYDHSNGRYDKDDNKNDSNARRRYGDDRYVDWNAYVRQLRADERRDDTRITRYSEPERIYFRDAVEEYFVSAPFRAARAELHPYFRNSPGRGYLPVQQVNRADYQRLLQDQVARGVYGISLSTPSASAACQNYTVVQYSQRTPSFVESCN
jgi:hypothetical protein